MEVVDKKGQIISTEWETVNHEIFLNEIIKPFTQIMVGVGGGKEPFACVYFVVSKQDVIDTVRMNEMEVTYSIMFNSKVQPKLKDVLYIKKLKMTWLDEKPKIKPKTI